jgi:hypothetical protein
LFVGSAVNAARLPYWRPWQATLASEAETDSKIAPKPRAANGNKQGPHYFGLRATARMTTAPRRADLASITSAIERSQILLPRVLARPAARPAVHLACRFDLPVAFEDADLAILDWIAAEGLRTSGDICRYSRTDATPIASRLAH